MSEVGRSFKTTVLRRGLQHFVDYSVRPTAHKIPNKHLDFEKVLPVQMLHLPVGYRTHFTSSGWGSHLLTAAKLGNLWGLLLPLTFTYPLLIPVDILHSLLRSIVGDSPVLHPKGKTILQPPIHEEDRRGAFIHSLNRFLPHSWQDDVENMVSTKSDSAQTPLHFWNKRTSLLFPSFTS